MIKVLVLSADYPNNVGSHERMYVHTRNIYYQKCGIDVSVINFKAHDDYVIDGIQVYTLSSYEKNNESYDVLISHQSNIRNHFLFLKRHADEFNRIIFFFHGHEIMFLNHTYPRPYAFCKNKSIIKILFQEIYDFFKTEIWHFYLPTIIQKSEIVYVSEYVREMFYKNIKIDANILNGHEHIINNGVSKIFEEKSYDYNCEKKYDFVTIRSNWDSSVYCIDLLVKLALANPHRKFLLIGKGKYFRYNVCPTNLILIEKTISHNEMVDYLNQSKCAINLTRQDTQGVMTCELLTYGIPVITSNIPVAIAFFGNKKNIALLDNNSLPIELDAILNSLQNNISSQKDHSFFEINTVLKEVELINCK